MAQSTILAVGTTDAVSTDVTIASGEVKAVGIFASGVIPYASSLTVHMDTPGGDVVVSKLSYPYPSIALVGPGTYRIVRKNQTQAIGAYLEA
jgi:hypothetical protein